MNSHSEKAQISPVMQTEQRKWQPSEAYAVRLHMMGNIFWLEPTRINSLQTDETYVLKLYEAIECSISVQITKKRVSS